jgi:rubrerythrin
MGTNSRQGEIMSAIPRASALQLASDARDTGAEALRGLLEKNENGRWTVGHIEIESWLSRHAGQELVLIAAALDNETPVAYTRVCRTCGNDYEGRVCPHCAAVRRRLRGE